MSIETEQELFSKNKERAERAVESKESKEGEIDEELKRAAVMERADYLVKEVKSSQQQIQNILVHMQDVLQALAQLKAQLAISDPDEPESVKLDKKQIEKIKEKIAGHKDELLKMKDELIEAQLEKLEQEGYAQDELKKRAEQLISQVLEAVESNET